MAKDSLVSIIVPVYNVEDYVTECVDSILGQSHRHIEVILVDDGSTDRSGEICDNYALMDKRVKTVHRPNGGLSAARNTGMSLATGDYMAFVDSDDIIHEKYIDCLLTLINTHDAEIASVRYIRFASHKPTDITLSGEVMTMDATKAMSMILYQDTIDNSICTKLYRRSLLESVEFPVGIYYEDLATFYRIYERATRVVHCDIPLYFYRYRDSSILGEFTLKRADVLDVVDEIERHMIHNHPCLIKAAQDRKFSANMNILWLMSATGISSRQIIDRCWHNIRQLRFGSLFDKHVRIKNKIGALASLFGLCFLQSVLSKFKAS